MTISLNSTQNVPPAAKTTVIIVNYNSGDHIRQCLKSVFSAKVDIEVLVIDNASTDGSLIFEKEMRDRVRLIRNHKNVGFGAAVNIAIRQSRTEYILLLNPDTEGIGDFISPLIAMLDKQRGEGIVGGRILNPNGTLQKACLRSIPTPGAALLRLCGISLLFPNLKCVQQYNLTYNDDKTPIEVGAVSGSFCMFSKQTGESIGFDERFFLYGEDLDFCYRAAQAKMPVTFVPSASAVHYKGVSTKSRPIASLFHFYNSMLLFYRKHFAKSHSAAFNFLVLIGALSLGLPRIIWATAAAILRRMRPLRR
ncbi:glycosyltransferase family 2 protein [bacterium]|nr:glycosyltransferase family 2 protein [bacterium]